MSGPRPVCASPVVDDPTGDHHDGMPTYGWRNAPEHLYTYRQLASQGLRPGGRPPVAVLLAKSDGRLWAWLYDRRTAKPRRRLTSALVAGARAAARSRYRCCSCPRTDLTFIPRQGPPNYGRCPDCMGEAS